MCAEEKKYILRALQYCQDDASSRKGWWYVSLSLRLSLADVVHTRTSLANDRYIDKHGQPRGPYSTEQMKLWHDAGHFSNEMMVRNGDNGVFTDLGSLGADAFQRDAEGAFKDALRSIERVLEKYD